VKDRPIRSFVAATSSAGMVVVRHALGWRPCTPAVCIRRRTRSTPMACPEATRSAWIRRTPAFPREASWNATMRLVNAESSRSRCEGPRLRQASYPARDTPKWVHMKDTSYKP